MNTMIRSDFLLMRGTLGQLALISAGIAIIMAVATHSITGAVAIIAVMIPYTFIFNLAAYDEQNNWERFRLTLPLSRRQIVFGRYASLFLLILIACAFSFVLCEAVTHGMRLFAGVTDAANDASIWEEASTFAYGFEVPPRAVVVAALMATAAITFTGCAVVLPLIARFGLTKAVRFVPFAIVIVLAVGIGFVGDSAGADLEAFFGQFFVGDSLAPLLLLAGGALLVALVLYIVSAFIAAALYKNRAF